MLRLYGKRVQIACLSQRSHASFSALKWHDFFILPLQGGNRIFQNVNFIDVLLRMFVQYESSRYFFPTLKDASVFFLSTEINKGVESTLQ